MNLKNTELSKEITSKILLYYENYYKNTLGLKNWEALCKDRINEEEIYCSKYISRIQEWINMDLFQKKVLVVGSGTGGELVNFHCEGAKVYGIEPYEPALEICRLKAQISGFPETNIKNCNAEEIDFEDDFFDLVYCYTVIEHVDNVSKSIDEMLRVSKSGGYVFLQMPDYRQMYEGHYKLPLPMFLPKWINKIILKILGRPENFLDTINKVTSKSILKILLKHPVTCMQVHMHKEPRTSRRIIVRSIFFVQDMIQKIFNAPINQVWLVKKN